MDSKKTKRLLIIIVLTGALLLTIGSLFGERISDFMSGFITGLSFTVIVGVLIIFGAKINKK